MKMPNTEIGTRFFAGRTEMELVSITPVDPTYVNSIRVMLETGKDLCYYNARKVLKSGKLSKTSSSFLRFAATGNLIRL